MCFLFVQLDIFQLVGAPLVENCLAGFNSSVFAYGQVYFNCKVLINSICGVILDFKLQFIDQLCYACLIRREVGKHILCGDRPMLCLGKARRVTSKV